MADPLHGWTTGAVFGVCIAVVCLCLLGTGTVAAQQVDVAASELEGSGTTDDPYIITNVSELQAMEDDTEAHYEVTTDIDASNTAQWNSGKGFDPVEGFGGSLDGNKHTIRGLTINRPGERNTGLFGVSDGMLTDISLTGISISGASRVGGLAGANRGGTVKNVTVSGSVAESPQNARSVGGLVGSNARDSVIRNSSATAEISGAVDVGGLLGRNIGTIVDSHASGDVTGRTDTSQRRSGNRVGGLAGYNQGSIRRSYATGTVTGGTRVGGLVGINFDYNDTKTVVRNSYATGDVTGGGSVGGLVGSNFEGAVVGNLVPSLEIRVTNSYATGDVSGNDNTGGLVGYNNGSIARSFATGEVVGGDGDVGGLTGDNDESADNSYWDTQATDQSVSAGAATGLSTAQMQGQAARQNMPGLDFESNWTTVVAGDSIPPTPERDGYPILSAPDAEVQLDAVLAAGSTGPDRGPEIIPGTPSEDTDGDGRIDDLNGNGEIDRGDAQALFANLGSQALSENTGLFDYNGNDRVDRGDVQALFIEAQG